MTEFTLVEDILKNSRSKIWDIAKTEWKLDGISYSDEPDTCLCGHYPIKELCHIRNIYTQIEVTVGNCCINKFIGLKPKKYFNTLKRVKQNIHLPFNADFIHLAYEKKVINLWEKTFYLDTWRRRKLSVNQIMKRAEINKKILQNQDTLGGKQ